LNKELPQEEIDIFVVKIEQDLKPNVIKMLQVLLKIANFADYDQDVIWVSKICLELGKLLEEKGNFLESMQHFRFAYNKIVQYRDNKLEKGLEAQKDQI
jgi:hypothetical protein